MPGRNGEILAGNGVVVLLLAIAAYFLIACLVSWLVFFPGGRALVLQVVAQCARSARQRVSQQKLPPVRLGPMPDVGAWIRRHYVLCLGAAALLSIPPLLAFMAGGKQMLGGYAVSVREENAQVTALLQGEQLAPPEALPPAVFVTPEVAQERPLLASASRNWALLDADFTQRLLLVFKIMKEQHGYDMAILEGYRSPERQDRLAALGGSVTNAGAYQSWHQYGLAADCAFMRDGKLVISEKDPWAMRGYTLYGQVAESVGLTWGGRWKMMDFGHAELRVAGVMKRKQ